MNVLKVLHKLSSFFRTNNFISNIFKTFFVKIGYIRTVLLACSFLVLALSCFNYSQARVSDKVKFAENNPISDNMCKIYYATTGTIARVIAIFVIVVTAVGFFLGKVSWGIIISIGIAIGLMFSGRSLLQTFVGPKASSGCECKAGTSAFGLSCTARPIQAGT